MNDKKIIDSSEFKHAKAEAERYAGNTGKANELIAKSNAKLRTVKGNALSQVFDDLATLIRMLAAYYKNEYRNVPRDAIIMILCGLIYYVNPADLLPDIIPGLGFLDDIIAIAFIVRTIQKVLDDFRDWEESDRAF